jgi:uncharacterized membrane protein YkvA (DUF1232 family)
MTWLSLAKDQAKHLKRDILALWLAARDPRVPWYAKLLAGCVAAYALSPIDLIPDFIPIIGYLDDIIIVPLGIIATLALIPKPLMDEFREAAAAREDRPKSIFAAAVIVIIWISAASGLAWSFYGFRLAQ